MNRDTVRDIELLANKIANLLKNENPYITVAITDSYIKITEDKYGFIVKGD